MGVHGVAGFVGDGAPGVPDHELVVVAYAAEEGLVKQVPGHVLDHRSVPGEDGLSVDDFVLLEYFFCQEIYKIKYRVASPKKGTI